MANRRSSFIVILILLVLIIISSIGFYEKAKTYNLLQKKYEMLDRNYEDLLDDLETKIENEASRLELEGLLADFRMRKRALDSESIFSADLDGYQQSFDTYRRKLLTFYSGQLAEVNEALAKEKEEKLSLKEDFEEAQGSVSSLKNDISSLRNRLAIKDNKIEDLLITVEKMRERIMELESSETVVYLPSPATTTPVVTSSGSSSIPSKPVIPEIKNAGFYLDMGADKILLNNAPGHEFSSFNRINVVYEFRGPEKVFDYMMKIVLVENRTNRIVAENNPVLRHGKWNMDFEFDEFNRPKPGYYEIKIEFDEKMYVTHKFKIVEDGKEAPKLNEIYAYYKKKDKKKEVDIILDMNRNKHKGRRVRKVYIAFSLDFPSRPLGTKVICKIYKDNVVYREIPIVNQSNLFEGVLNFPNAGMKRGIYKIEVFYQGGRSLGAKSFRIS